MATLDNITTSQAGATQAAAYRIIKKQTVKALRGYDLSCMQWFTIGMVRDAGPGGIRLSDLAKKLDTTMGYMTNTVNMLESRNILTRTSHETDARTKQIAVNPSYIAKCNEIENHVRGQLRTVLYSNISHQELATYIKVILTISTLK